MRFHFGNAIPIGRVAESVPLYGRREFQSPTRSTIPLLSLLIHAPEKFDKIVDSLGMPACCDLHLEYTVSPLKGKGKASHTDVMLRSGADTLGIEAKWTEPLDKPIRTWRDAGTDRANRVAVLEDWLDLLRQRTSKSLDAAEFDDLPYQMLHRAASAATGDRPRLAYFLFVVKGVKPGVTPDKVFQKLNDLWARFGKPESFPFFLIEINAHPLEAYMPLAGLPKKQDSTSKAVSAALQGSSPLFHFDDVRCRKVGGEA